MDGSIDAEIVRVMVLTAADKPRARVGNFPVELIAMAMANPPASAYTVEVSFALTVTAPPATTVAAEMDAVLLPLIVFPDPAPAPARDIWVLAALPPLALVTSSAPAMVMALMVGVAVVFTVTEPMAVTGILLAVVPATDAVTVEVTSLMASETPKDADLPPCEL